MIIPQWIRVKRTTLKSAAAIWLFFGVVGLAIAGTAFADYLKALAQRESSMNPAAELNGYIGLFQMGTMAMTDAGYYRPMGTGVNSWGGVFTGKDGLTSLAQFKASPDIQVKAVTAYINKVQGYISSFGLGRYIGQTINGVEITMSGILAGAHLVGIGSLKQYLESGGSIIPRDGNNVPITDYIAQFGGYSISSSAPSYADVLGAAPSGSVPVTPGTGPGTGPTGPLPGLPTPPTFSNSEEAFAATSGYSMFEVGEFFRLCVGALICAWAGYLFYSSSRAYFDGRRAVFHVGKSGVRIIVVLVIFLWLIR